MIKQIQVRPYMDYELVDLFYNGQYVATIGEHEFLQFRLDVVKAAIEQGTTGESGYTLKCHIDTNGEPQLGEVIIYCDGNLSNMPYEFSYCRRSCKEIYELTHPEQINK